MLSYSERLAAYANRIVGRLSYSYNGLRLNMQATKRVTTEHMWDSGGSKSGEWDCSSIKVQNDGSLALDQKQIECRYVINYTLFTLFCQCTFCS